jgi:hypothetical protein
VTPPGSKIRVGKFPASPVWGGVRIAHGSAVGIGALAGYHVKSLVDAIDYFPDAG